MRTRGTRRAAATTRQLRRRKAAIGWTIGVAATVLFGVIGASVAGALIGQPASGTTPPAATDSLDPVEAGASTPTSTPTPSTPPPPPLPPVSPADTRCATAVTMSVWAHYDDDLIFANPPLTDAMASGECIRSLFLTASDAGRGWGYSQGRELGILRAYNVMRGQEGLWSEKRVTLLSGAVLSQWSPDGDPDITVAFLRLPDGNITGEGFASTGYAALPELLSGALATMSPIDGSPALSSESLVASIAEVIQAYHAARLITHVPSTAAQWAAGDHPDHGATGAFSRAGWQRAGFPAAQVQYAIGYPSEGLPVNVTGDALARKLAAFRIYAAQDPVVSCGTDAACLATPRFGDWLQRNYFATDAELFPAG